MAVYEFSEPPRVIVRAWGDEPVTQWLYLIDTDRHIAKIGGNSARFPIGIPSADVYPYRPLEYSKMRHAYDLSDKDALSAIYACSVGVEGIDNLIPTEIDSEYGEERVPHPQQPSEGVSQ